MPVGSRKFTCFTLRPEIDTGVTCAAIILKVMLLLSVTITPTAEADSKKASYRFSANTITPVFRINGPFTMFAGLTTRNGSLRNNTESTAAT